MKHAFANIHPDAKIADSAIIDAFVSIDKDVVIGERVRIYPNAVISEGARIADEVTIFPGSVISAIPQDLKFTGEYTTTEIGHNTTIREYVTINRGTSAKGKTVVGNNCLLMAYSHVAHDCIIGNNIILANGVQLAGEVEVDDFAILGGGTLVHQFTKIGMHVMTQGGLLLGKDIPPYVTSAREPASFAGLNIVGLKRRGFSTEAINRIHDIYRILFSSGLNYKEAIKKMEGEIPESDEKKNIMDFIKRSNRGLIPGYTPTK
jgi:UDP-N-acetylglucosamine acyltransferase